MNKITDSDSKKNSKKPSNLNRRQSQSAECLKMNPVNGNGERKASTPTLDRTAQSESPDISCIGKLLNQSHHTDSSQLKVNQASNGETNEDSEIETRLEHEYILGIQAAFRCELEKRRASEVNDMLQGLQERLSKCQKILVKNKLRIKRINFNKEIELLHSIHYPNYAKVLENIDAMNCEEELAELQQKLEDEQNLLQLKNVTMPSSGGGAELCSLIADTAEQFKKLQANSELEETHKLLKEVGDINTVTKNALERCTVSFSQAESLVLQKKTLERSLHYLQFDHLSPKD